LNILASMFGRLLAEFLKMPRKNLIRSASIPYHVTARSNNKETFPLNLNEMWNVLVTEIYFLHLIYEVEFHSFLLMPNHFHMTLSVPKFDLGKVMNLFMAATTRITNSRSGRSGHIYGGPYHWTLINSDRYFWTALKYIYRNPVRAKLCLKVEEYPYSSLYGLLGLSHLPFPIHFTRLGMELGRHQYEPSEILDWLNEPFTTEAENTIRNGLTKKILDEMKNRKTRKPIEINAPPLPKGGPDLKWSEL
jgi:putative transposase